LRDTVAAKGVPVFAIDPHEEWAARSLLKEAGQTTDDLHVPLLLDASLTVTAEYGVPFQMRIHVEESTRPTTFLIDKAGVLRFERRAQSYSDRPSPQDILREIEKLD
jgi:peroxiredoxin